MHRYYTFTPVSIAPYEAVGGGCLKWEQKLEGETLKFDKIVEMIKTDPKVTASSQKVKEDLEFVDNNLASILVVDLDVENSLAYLENTYPKWRVQPNGKLLKNH